ncbi:MAG: modulator of FtsH protease HflK [Aliidongia sp.]|jgi:membrane protease subunit HflK|nr:modulator of FtsH protease HflK [Aliidongia sp.]
MPWKEQGGGGGGPWGGGNGQGPWGRGPGGGGRGPQPPNLEELIRRIQDRLRKIIPGGGGGGIVLAAGAVILLLWSATGIYRVGPDELGVVMRFGAYHETTVPGLHYHLPSPIESVETPKVTLVNRTEIGVAGESLRGNARQELPEEALMLTGDENIVDINVTVLWVIKNAQDYLFKIRNPGQAVKSAGEAAIREIVGRTLIASVLAEGRGKVETDTQALLQSILDSYDAGVQITQVQLQKADPPREVIDSFRDVQRALTDRDRAKNEAEAYHNDVVPRARGEAEKIVQAAGAYQQQVVAGAQGDAQRFVSVLNAYRVSKDVTAERLYLETMEQVLKKVNKVLIDKTAGVMPYLPLPGLASPKAPEPPAPAPAQPTISQGRTGR